MPTVSYRKYAGKKQANVKPMIVLIGVVMGILVASVTVAIIMKMTSGQKPVEDDAEALLPGTVEKPGEDKDEEEKMIEKIIIKVAESEFTATLEQNETAQAFARLLPLEKNMVELNGNEKYYDVHQNLPSDPKRVGRIEVGDLMLFQNNFIVVFYKSHSTNYSYTRIGRIDDPTGLAEAVGSGDVMMEFVVADDIGGME